MDRPALSDSELALLARARDFAGAVIAPNADAWESAGGGLPMAVVREYAALGLAGLQVPPEHGGAGASFHAKLRVAEAMAEHCFAAAFALNNYQGSATRLVREGTPDQIARYLPAMLRGDLVGSPSLSEPEAGSDFAAIRTQAVREDGGWRLNGEKAWVTNGVLAGQLLMYAQTEPGSGARGIASFLVDLDLPGITRRPAEAVAGGAAIGACSIVLQDVVVSADHLFAAPGQAFKRGLRGITAARVHVAAMIAASVEACLRIAVTHGGTRQAFGRPLLGHQGLRWDLADVAVALESARLLIDRAAVAIEAGADAQIEAAMAKKAAVEMASPAVATCMQAMGAAGLRRSYPFGRHLLAARVAAYTDGTTEMMNERIGAALASRYGGT